MKKWEILVLSQPSRVLFLRDLLEAFGPQIGGKDIGLRVHKYDPSKMLGENREELRQASESEYISFFDDDDLPAKNYVDRILPLLDGVDYVGFRLQFYINFKPQRMTYNSLRYGRWYEDPSGYYRDISHICPMRRDLALRVPMEGPAGEDSRWSSKMRNLGIVKTEHVVNEVLYHYLFRPVKNDAQDAHDSRRRRLSEQVNPTPEVARIQHRPI